MRCLLAALLLVQADAPKAAGPLDPEAERATFRLPEGFRADLVACEPDVIDPVAMAFDENGRLYVVEMPGYPNAGVAEGKPRVAGRVRLLEKPDEAHRYRKSTVFVDGLDFATSVMPYRKGVLVASAPDILYFEDSDGDGRADVRRVLYTGFGRKNIQAQLNGLQWALDNRVHGLGAGNGGEIRSPEKPEMPLLSLGGRSFRFRPDLPGSLEPTTGGGQFGLAADDWGQWFTCTNSQHLRHVVGRDLYLARNPYVTGPAGILDIPDHGAAAKVHRLSAFEPWRVERTTRRAGAPDSSRFARTELVPGGFVTSATGLAVYRADLFPEPYRGSVFVGDPANNLIHRDALVPIGVTFAARRAEGEEDREFLASTDNWFRPSFLTVGPDGALYVADFYREVIETPLSLPEDIKARLNLESRDRGRIWRIAPAEARAVVAPALGRASAEEIAAHLGHPNAWWRMTAQRLLVQDRRKEAVPAVRALAESRSPLARLHALCTLDGLGALDGESVARALQDPEPGVREHAVRLAEGRLPGPEPLRALAEDPSPRVRCQVAYTLGEFKGTGRIEILAAIARRDGADGYVRAAILSSTGDDVLALYDKCSDAGALLPDLAKVIGARLDGGEISGLLARLERSGTDEARAATLRGLAQGIRQRRKQNLELPAARAPLLALAQAKSEAVRKAAAELASLVRMMTDAELRAAVEKAKAAALDEKRPVKERAEAALLMGSGDFAGVARPLAELLQPRHPEPLQLAALQALDALPGPGVVGLLAENWRRLTPAVRANAVQVALGRKDRLRSLLEAVSRGDIPPEYVDSVARAQLFSFPDQEIAERARAVFQAAPPDERLFDQYKPALGLAGEARRGEATFRKLCLGCHQVGKEGTAVGPGLASVRDNPAEQLLRNILYPSLTVLPNYVQYLVETQDGQILNGVVLSATGANLTLRRQGAEDVTVLRKDIKTLASSQVSAMPEGLLKDLGTQDVADLLEFVRQIR